MANATIEGGRKLPLFFNISFAWKMALGWFIVWQGYDVKTTDFYGFGYLLSTLIAIKAHDKNIFPSRPLDPAGELHGRRLRQYRRFRALCGGLVRPRRRADGRSGRGVSQRRAHRYACRERNRRRAYPQGLGKAAPLSDGAREDLAELVCALQRGVPASSPDFDMQAEGWRLMAVGRVVGDSPGR